MLSISMNRTATVMKRILPKSGFLLRVTTLAGSTALSQGLVFAISPVLTRLYKPEEFGILGVYMSVLSMVVVVSSLRFEFAIPLPGSDAVAANLFGAAFLTLSVICLLFGGGLLVFGAELIKFTKAPGLQDFLWLLPVGVAVTGVYNILTFWALRYKGINSLARTKLIQSIGMISTQTVLGFLRVGSLGLVVGYIIGSSGGIKTLFKFAWKQSGDSLKAVSFKGIQQAVKRYRNFPLYSSFSSLLNTAGLNMPTLLIAGVYGSQVAGWFALVHKMISAPITLIGKSVAQVYISEAPVLLREQPQKLIKLFSRASIRLLLLSAVPGLIFVIAGPWLFSLFFGDEWRTSGSFVQILAIMFVTKFVASPLSHTLIILEKQGWQLCWDAGRLILVLGVFTAANVRGYSASAAVALYSLTMSIAYVLLLFVSFLALKRAAEAGGRNNQA